MIKKIYIQKPKIALDIDVKKRLDKFGNKGDTYNDIIIKLLDNNKKKIDK